MQFRFQGFGSSLSTPLVVHFRAETEREACESGLRVLNAVPECEWAEVTAPGFRIELVAGSPPGRGAQPRLVTIS